MLQAVLHGKSKAKHEEDTLTSSVFSLLVLLPDPVLWEILRRATDGKLPPDGGALQDYAFWPHWNHEGTGNTRFVEPDVYLKFGRCTLIVEAKYGTVQSEEQWKKEIRACRNEKLLSEPACLIAMDGNTDAQETRLEGIAVLKSDWFKLSIAASELLESPVAASCGETAAAQRTLRLLLQALRAFGFFGQRFLDSLGPLLPGDLSGAEQYFREMRINSFYPSFKSLAAFSDFNPDRMHFDNWAHALARQGVL